MITIERVLPDDQIDRFYALYRAAFEPMRLRAAARHLLSAEEFADEMRDERIDKYVAWNEAGTAVGLTTITADLTSVPWTEPRFHAARHPEQAARGTLFHLGYLLADPNAEGDRVVKAMADTVLQRVADARGVMALDACEFNAKQAIGRMAASIPEN